MPTPPKLVNSRLVYAMSHPTRVHALSVLTDRVASPKELAAELDLGLNRVGYHMDILKGLGMIELVRTESAANGRSVEHFYRAVERAWFDRDAWKELGGPSKQPGVTGAIMALINEEIAKAITAGTFDGAENHISRTPLLLDPESYGELIALLTTTLEEGLFSIRERAANRITPETETISTVVNIIQFDLPKPKP
jgi:DNA-binding transcriptional ArsR family regulator